jgi:hypothetical protein
MEWYYLLVFVGGLLVGILVILFMGAKIQPELRDMIPRPEIGKIECQSGGSLSIEVSVGTPPTGMVLVALHSHVYEILTGDPPAAPPSGSTSHGASLTTITHPAAPSGGTVVVWAEYHGHSWQTREYVCSNGSSNGMKQMLPMIAAGATGVLDAIPKNLLIAPAPGTPGASTGPAAELVGALAQSPESVLRYVAEASTPAEPLWRALGGPRAPFEATLVLLHRTGGVGAVLTIVTEVGGRRVQFTWVTSNWAFNGANRLRSESDEPGLPALVVAPA